jgi:hypothetical protein
MRWRPPTSRKKASLSQAQGPDCAGSIDHETLRQRWASGDREGQIAISLAKAAKFAKKSQNQMRGMRAAHLLFLILSFPCEPWASSGTSCSPSMRPESRATSHAFAFDWPVRLCASPETSSAGIMHSLTLLPHLTHLILTFLCELCGLGEKNCYLPLAITAGPPLT